MNHDKINHHTHSLSEVQRQYEFIVNASKDLMTLISANYEYEAVNEAFCRAHNKPREDLIGHTIADIWGWEVFERSIKRHVDQCLQGSEIQYHAWLETSDRGRRYFDVTYYPYYNSQRQVTHAAVVSRDVTESKHAEEALVRRDKISRAVSYVAGRFIESTSNWSEVFTDALGRLGTATEVSRVYVFENHRDHNNKLSTVQKYEWTSPHITSSFDSRRLQDFVYDDSEFERWVEILKRGDVIKGNVSEFPEDERKVLSKQGIRSLLIVPVFVENEWWGHIGFDECEQEREWTAMEVDALKTAANTLAAAIRRKRTDSALRKSEERLSLIYNTVSDAIVLFRVEPPSRFKILTINKAFFTQTGFKEQDLKSEYLDELVPPIVYTRFFKDYIRDVIAYKKPIKHERTLFFPKGRSVFETTVVPILNEDEECTHLLVVGRDITARKKAERILRDSEDRYRRLVELSPNAIAVHADGVLVYANSAAVKLLGANHRSEIVGRPMLDFVHQDFHDVVKNRVRIMRSGSKEEIPIIEEKFLKIDGTPIDVEVGAMAFTFEGKPAVQVVVRDITERKQAEEELRDSEERFRKIFEEGPLGMTMIDEHLRFVKVNETFQKMLGYSEHELIGRSFKDVTHPEHVIVNTAHAQKLISREIPRYRTEKRYITKHGEEIWVTVTSTAIRSGKEQTDYLLSMVEDITNRKHAEEQLRAHTKALASAKKQIEREKAQDEALLASIGEGIIATDQQGCVVMMNESALESLGIKAEDVIGKPLFDVAPLTHEDGAEVSSADRPIRKVLVTGKKVSTSDYYYRRSDGSKFPAAITGSPVIFQGAIMGAIVVFRDISREKEIDRAKSEFISLASHQLSTPLSAVKWYTEMLIQSKTAQLSPKQEKYLHEVYRANQRMITMVDTFLNVSRIELGAIGVSNEQIDIKKLSQSILDEFELIIEEKQISVHKLIDPETPLIKADTELIRIIFHNLISNAIKYTPQGGTVTVTTAPLLEVQSSRSIGVKITVQDTGYGIPLSQQGKIFSKLFRADNVIARSTDGTGLGLYIVKGIVDSYGGTISFESKENQGTIFRVSLPLGRA